MKILGGILIAILLSYMIPIFGWVGFTIVIHSLQTIWRGVQSRRWPAIQAQVTGCTIHRHDDGMSPTIYMHQLSFSYLVHGVKYQSGSCTGRSFSSHEAAQKAVLSESPIGQPVTVFYHPQKPHIYVLAPGLRPGMFLEFLFGFLFLSGSVILALNVLIWVLGFLLIGPPPETECYQPNLSTKEWITIPCPPSKAP